MADVKVDWYDNLYRDMLITVGNDDDGQESGEAGLPKGANDVQKNVLSHMYEGDFTLVIDEQGNVTFRLGTSKILDYDPNKGDAD